METAAIETADLCKACHQPLQIGLNICPHCKTVQHQVYQPADEVKEKSSTHQLRWVYGVLFIALIIFLGVMFVQHRGDGRNSMASACATMKATGYAGSVQDCLNKMGEPSGR